MKARLVHHNIHVIDLDASLAFYGRALGMHELRRKGPDDGTWIICYIGNDESDFELELTWNRGRTKPYDNGDGDTHLAVVVDDIGAAHELHDEMGCIAYENPSMGLYFITDPDGCWIEVLPQGR